MSAAEHNLNPLSLWATGSVGWEEELGYIWTQLRAAKERVLR